MRKEKKKYKTEHWRIVEKYDKHNRHILGIPESRAKKTNNVWELSEIGDRHGPTDPEGSQNIKEHQIKENENEQTN